MLNNKFYKKLESYINKTYQNTNAPAFKYDENTAMTPEVAKEIYLMYQQLFSIQQLWEKEKDYSRLLKKENNELKKGLDSYFYSEDDEYGELDIPNVKEKEYIS
jgi:hypothetical protein